MNQIWLTKNEKRILKLLIENSRISDTDIAKELDITSQAVGRIRKELEEVGLIRGYTLELDQKMIGLNILVIIAIDIGSCDNKYAEILENKIKKYPEVFTFLKTISGKREFRYLAGFRNMEELEKFVDREREIKDANNDCLITEVVVLSPKEVLKNSMKDNYNQLIDSCGTKHLDVDIN
jgi:DNA-binding Lrp family transcriptional regulator